MLLLNPVRIRNGGYNTMRLRGFTFLLILPVIISIIFSFIPIPTEAQISDTTPPSLLDLDFTPTFVDTTLSSRSIAVTARAVDDLTGIAGLGVNFTSPSGSYGVSAFIYPPPPGSPSPPGPALPEEVWEGTATFPQYSEAGTWTASVNLSDRISNYISFSTAELQARGFPTEVVISSLKEDLTPPSLLNLDFTPTFVDTTLSSRDIAVTARAVDDLTGIAGLGVNFTSPSGSHGVSAFIYPPPPESPSPPGPALLEEVWEGTATFPQYSEAGTWTASVNLSDRISNYISLSTADLEAQGFPADMIVVQPSLISDGTFLSTGGTVTDDVFIERAQVSLPPGVLTETTDVSIDVFESPLDIPSPSGFAGLGTYFVNIFLDPEPLFPLPAPGITVVLPLVNFIEPGSLLDLFRIDPTTGDLVPTEGVDGLPVVGAVNDEGLSATFTGVAHLSVVVGFIPEELLLGDLNGDGSVNIDDMNILFDKIRSPPPHDPIFDLNEDGVVNIADARKLVTLCTRPGCATE